MSPAAGEPDETRQDDSAAVEPESAREPEAGPDEARIAELWSLTLDSAEDFDAADPGLSYGSRTRPMTGLDGGSGTKSPIATLVIAPPPDSRDGTGDATDTGDTAADSAASSDSEDPGAGTVALAEADILRPSRSVIGLEPSDPDVTLPDAVAASRGPLANSLTDDAALRPGAYELGETLGEGGMGVVFRARQTSLGREVAVKTLRPDAEGDDSRERFIAEARVAGCLDHPNIVPVHDLGEAPDGRVMLAMKLVGGCSWKQLLQPESAEELEAASRYETEDHLRILISVCRALEFAHARGITHNDLKPDNIMIGDYGEVLVMDWGLATDVRPEEQRRDGCRALPREAIRAPCGTPKYMAPELALGRGEDLSERTDVYLLGAILCELLRGRPPHTGRSFMAVLLSAVEARPPELPEDLPREIRDICLRALAEKPGDRFRSVAELRAALEAYLRHRESHAMTARARDALDRLEPERASQDRDQVYIALAEIVAGFREALEIWDGNSDARSGEAEARRLYAEVALTQGDLGLAAVQAARLGPEDEALRDRVLAAADEREEARRRAHRTRRLLAGALGLLMLAMVVGTLLVARQRNAAMAARAVAEDQARIAREARGQAEAEAARARRAEALARREQELARRRLIESLCGQAAMLGKDHRWGAARKVIAEARGLDSSDSLSVRLMDWLASRRSPEPLVEAPLSRFALTTIAAEPDGRTLYVGDAAGAVRKVDLETGAVQALLLSLKGSITGLAVDATGEVLVAGSSEGALRRVGTSGGGTIGRRPDDRQGAITGLTLGPGGQVLVTTDKTGLLRLETPGSRPRERKTRSGQDASRGVILAPTGLHLAALRRNRIELLDLSFLRPKRFLDGTSSFTELAWDAAGTTLVTGNIGGEVGLYKLEDGRQRLVTPALPDTISAVTLTPSGRELIACDISGQIRRIRVRDGAVLEALAVDAHALAAAALEDLFVTAHRDGVLRVWAAGAGGEARAIGEHGRRIDDVQTSEDGAVLLTRVRRTLSLRDPTSGLVLASHKLGSQEKAFGVPVDSAGRVLIVDGVTVELRDLIRDQTRAFEPRLPSEVTRLAVAPDRSVLIGTRGGGLWRVRAPDYAALTRVWAEGSLGPIRALAAGDSGLIAACDDEGRLRADAPDGRVWTAKAEGSDGSRRPKSRLFVAGPRRILLAGWRYGTIELADWDPESSNPGPLRELPGHTGYVQGLDLAPDGRHLFSAGTDGTVRIWDLAADRERHLLRPELGSLSGLRLLRGGRGLVVMAAGGRFTVWRFDRPDQLIKPRASARAARQTLIKQPDSVEALTAYGLWFERHGLGARAWPRLAEAVKRGAVIDGAVYARAAIAAERLTEGLRGLARLESSTPLLELWRRALQARAGSRAGGLDLGRATAHAISLDGRTAVTGHDDGALRVWSIADRRRVATLRGHSGRVTALAFGAKDELFSLGPENILRGWRLDKRAAVLNGDLCADPITALAVGGDPMTVVAGSTGGELVHWRPRAFRGFRPFKLKAPVRGVAVIGSGVMALAIDGAGHLRRRGLREPDGLEVELYGTPRFAVAPSGRELAIATRRQLCLFDVGPEGLRQRAEVELPRAITALDWGPGGELISGNGSGDLQRHDTARGTLLASAPTKLGSIEALRVVTGGLAVAIGSRGRLGLVPVPQPESEKPR